MPSVRENFVSLPRAIRFRFFVWAAFCAALLGVFGGIVLPNLRYETDLMALLPKAQQDRELDAAVERFTEAMSRRVVFLISANDVSMAKIAADAFATELERSGQFVEAQSRFGGNLSAQIALYKTHSSGLISAQRAQELRNGNEKKVFREALQQALTPAGFARPVGVSDDPLGLLSDFILAQAPIMGGAQLNGEHLVAEKEGRAYAMVVTEARASPFSGDFQALARHAIETAFEKAKQAASDGQVALLESGALQHAEAATNRAQAEVALFGTLSTAAMLIVVLIVLRGIAPIVLSVIVLAVSLVGSLTATYLIFGQVHLLALVFGSSLVGVVIDYSLHFLVDRYRDTVGKEAPGVEALRHVGPSLLWGCLATICGYAMLLWVPLPGLRQIAVFCFFGSLLGCLSVLSLYPVLNGKRATRSQAVLRLASAFDALLDFRAWNPLRKLTIGALALVFVILGCWKLSAQDNLRSLQSSTSELIEREKEVQRILGASIESGFFVVRGASIEATLQAEEALTDQLDTLAKQGALAGHIAITRSIPSLAKQTTNRQLQQSVLLVTDGIFEKILTTFGFSADAIAGKKATLNAESPLQFSDWLADPTSKPFRQFWLGKLGDRYATIVTVTGIHDLPSVAAAAQKIGESHQAESHQAESYQVVWIDRVADVSALLHDYRIVSSCMWAAIIAIILVVLGFRFGVRIAVRAALPSIMATLTTIAVFGWCGWNLNLFVVLAMLLVLALGIDYGLVLMNSDEARTTGVISVSLSALTTSFSFGLLSFSSTGFIASIGSGLGIGILLSWLIAIATCRRTLSTIA